MGDLVYLKKMFKCTRGNIVIVVKKIKLEFN